MNVYLNDEDVRCLEKDATAVQDGDSISIGAFDRGRPLIYVSSLDASHCPRLPLLLSLTALPRDPAQSQTNENRGLYGYHR